jgi:hypothetical protein
LGLADAVAKSGAKIVPVLLERIEHEERDVAKMQLIDVFERMQNLGYYAVAADKPTIAALQRQVEAMKDPQWKAMSADLLEKIRSANVK